MDYIRDGARIDFKIFLLAIIVIINYDIAMYLSLKQALYSKIIRHEMIWKSTRNRF